jgi:hypothetical protein
MGSRTAKSLGQNFPARNADHGDRKILVVTARHAAPIHRRAGLRVRNTPAARGWIFDLAGTTRNGVRYNRRHASKLARPQGSTKIAT